jgi:Nif-specific regulatory protein
MTDRATQELAVLYRISQAMLHRQAVSTLLQEVLDILEHEIGLSHGALALRKPDSDILVIEASRGLTPEEMQRGQYRIGEGSTAGGETMPAVTPGSSWLR